VALGLFTRWFHRGALITGLVAGLATGMVMLYQIPNPANGKAHFGGSGYALSNFGFSTTMTIYVGFVAVIVNLLVALIGTVVLRAGDIPDGEDGTQRPDYFADRDDPEVRDLPELVTEEPVS
jgi:SSS family solute:Na+ symporter